MSEPEGDFVLCADLIRVLTYTSRGLTQHLDYSLVIDKLSKHFGRVTEVSMPVPIASAARRTSAHRISGAGMQLTPLKYSLSLGQERPAPVSKVFRVFLHDNGRSRDIGALPPALLLCRIIEVAQRHSVSDIIV
jgi:hypothetical protein